MIEFNLQLFADGEGSATPGTTAAAPSTTTESTPSTTSVASESSSQEPALDYGESTRMLVTDPRTGRKSIVEQQPQGQQEAEAQPHQSAQEQSETQPAATPQTDGLIHTSPYTLDELNGAIANGAVDESRIPTAYQYQYAQYKQLQAQQQAQMQAQRQAMLEQQQQAAVEQQKKMFAEIEKAATAKAMQDYGVTQDDLDLAEYSDDEALRNKVQSYKTAVDWNRQALITSLQQNNLIAQQKAQTQQAIYQSIVAFEQDKKQNEPNFDKINELLSTRYQELPLKEARPIEEAITAMNNGTITEQQCKVLEKYYNDTRTYFYGQKNDLSRRPQKIQVPNVEQPGTGTPHTPPQAVDFNSLHSMSDRERRAFMAKYWGR